MASPPRGVWAATRQPKHDESFQRVLEDLLGLHYDYDLGDEIMISRHGSVKGKQFVIGQAAYKLVVIAEADTMFRSTAALLKKFLEAGGA